MKKEDKDLLLKDLAARLPYKVRIESYKLPWIELNADWYLFMVSHPQFAIRRPYLRPMSSMTEEEKKDLLVAVVGNECSKYFQVLQDGSIDNTDATIQDLNKFNMHWVCFNKDTVTLYLDWLLEHHFDYRNLIEKGLALKAPEEMYNS